MKLANKIRKSDSATEKAVDKNLDYSRNGYDRENSKEEEEAGLPIADEHAENDEERRERWDEVVVVVERTIPVDRDHDHDHIQSPKLVQ